MKTVEEEYYIKLICDAYSCGKSIEKAAIEAGECPNAVRKIKRKFGIGTKRFAPYNKKITDKMEEEMVELYKNNISSYKIADIFGFKTSKTLFVESYFCFIRRVCNSYSN